MKSGTKETKKEEQRRIHIELLERMITLVTSAFGLVAALAWNNVIQEFVDTYIKTLFPKGSGIISLLLYAVIITIFAVFITYQLSSLHRKMNEKK